MAPRAERNQSPKRLDFVNGLLKLTNELDPLLFRLFAFGYGGRQRQDGEADRKQSCLRSQQLVP